MNTRSTGKRAVRRRAPSGAGRQVLGLDLGTSSCKAVLVDAAGAVRHSAAESYPTAAPAPGWAEQAPAGWLKAAAGAVRRLWTEQGADPGSVAGLALTSAAHIGVLLDGRGEPVRPAILWNDQRSVDEVAGLEREAGAEILEATCQAVSTCWTLPHLAWVRRHEPEAWRRVRAVLLSKDFLVRWLTGRAVTDPGTAVSSQLYDVRAGGWSRRLCELAGVRPEMLPEVVPADACAGELGAAAAGALGLRAGLPVIAGTLDSATELLAAGLGAPGGGLVRLATAGGVELVVAAAVADRRRITYPHAVTPWWYCQAGTNTCAAAVQWAMGALGSGTGGADFAAWDAAAAGVADGSDGVLFHPYLAGERAPHWDPRLRGSFAGLSLRHGRGHLARAVYEGAACSIRQAMSVLPDLPAAADGAPLAVVGGGARSAVWVDILAQVLGRPLRIVEGADSSYGAALLGLASLGLAEAGLEPLLKERAEAGRAVRPDRERTECYDRHFEAYGDLHACLAPFYGRQAGRQETKGHES